MAGRNLTIRMRETDLLLVSGDLLEQQVDVIVNPANDKLQMEGGVAKAIAERGGPAIQEECERIGGAAVGTAVMTNAGELPVKHVIHAVGPKMGEGEEDRKLSSAVRSALALAERHGMRSIALPAIATGAHGVPIDRAARIMLTEVQRYIQGGTKLEQVVLVLDGDKTFDVFKRELRRGFR
jgi:O-acetyl-ADP-ribose deacetylase (regulator of RNase III)